MIRLPTVLLEHRLPGHWHFDWLLADPADPAGPLWTARVDQPPADWPNTGQLLLDPLPPHRRAYLDYQGPVSGNRGTVHRVDAGHHVPRLWTAARCLTTVTWEVAGAFEVELIRLPDAWQASLRRP